jgi:prepilin-type N-terminal cleavage/methylation domain-containing protein
MRKKRNFKGMTLVEIIVAMAILAIAGSVMCTAVSMVCKVKVNTNALNKKISYQAPIAGAKIKDGANEVEGEHTFTIQSTSDDTIKYKVSGKIYQVKSDDLLDYGKTIDGKTINGTETDSTVADNHNFKFFVIG